MQDLLLLLASGYAVTCFIPLLFVTVVYGIWMYQTWGDDWEL